MKKYFKILLLLLVVFTCVACQTKPFDLKEEYYKESKISEIDLDGLNKLIDDKESFGVFVYLPGCTSCAAFSEVLDEFLGENTISFYKTEIKYAKETDIGNKIKYAPSFVVFKEGKIVAYLDAESNKDLPYYKTVKDFKEWLTKYINLK